MRILYTACRFIFGVLGFTFVTIALTTTVRIRRFLAAAVKAPATIVANQARRSTGSASTAFYPTFRFIAADGRPVTVQSDTGSAPPEFRTGHEVEALYDPANPADARLNTPWQLWLFVRIFGWIGFAFLVAFTLLPLLRARLLAR